MRTFSESILFWGEWQGKLNKQSSLHISVKIFKMKKIYIKKTPAYCCQSKKDIVKLICTFIYIFWSQSNLQLNVF